MDNEDVLLGQLAIEVDEIANRFRECFEKSFGIAYDEYEAALAAVAQTMVYQALGQPFDTEDEEVRRALLGARDLERRASKSIMKRHLLYSLSIGRVCLDKVMDLAESGDVKAAIGALTAAAMASGSVQVAATEIAAKAAPGKATSPSEKIPSRNSPPRRSNVGDRTSHQIFPLHLPQKG
jgi:hypothetical protein